MSWGLSLEGGAGGEEEEAEGAGGRRSARDGSLRNLSSLDGELMAAALTSLRQEAGAGLTDAPARGSGSWS